MFKFLKITYQIVGAFVVWSLMLRNYQNIVKTKKVQTKLDNTLSTPEESFSEGFIDGVRKGRKDQGTSAGWQWAKDNPPAMNHHLKKDNPLNVDVIT